MLKVLHLVGGQLNAGAARGAYSLHKALCNDGVQSRVLTNSRRIVDDPSVTFIAKSSKEKFVNLVRTQMDKAPTWLYNLQTTDFSTAVTGFDFTKTPEFQAADILHMHWINGGFVNIRHLARVHKPTVWTLRDMWPLTGGCHYSLGCENYKAHCGNCPCLRSHQARDLSRWVLDRKIKYLPRNTTIVGISEWLAALAKESTIFREFDVRLIHNNIDTEEFFPVDRETARSVLGISGQKKIVLVGAQDLKSPFKGFDKFVDAVKRLDRNRCLLAFFGKVNEQVVKELNFDYKNFGYIQDTISLRLLYSASDVFVAPSLAEAFGKTVAESMACGTPVVCFDATGPRDIVDHQVNGYKAQPFDSEDLARGIQWILNSDSATLGINARQKIAAAFDSKIISTRYKELYRELVGASMLS